MKKYTLQANLLFLLFAALWGASFPVTKGALQIANPFLFVFLRFLFASIFLLPFIFSDKAGQQRSSLKMGMILGIMNTGVYMFETLGLHYISASRCAFITGTNVVLVPFIARAFRIGHFSLLEVLSAILCVVGLYILMDDKGSGLHLGDIYAFICAISIASSLVYVQHVADDRVNYKYLTFYQVAFTCPIPLVIYVTTQTPVSFGALHLVWTVILAALFCGIFSSALPLLGQMKLQKYTTATQTALIFALEPVFATLCSALFYHEVIPVATMIGGAIMIVSIVMPVLRTAMANRY